MIGLFRRLTGKRKALPVTRNIIIHNHLFKNAGSTIDWALKRNFPGGFVDHRDDAKMLEGAKYLGKYLLESPKIQALSTHHLALPLPVLDNVNLMMIMMFRHPIERVWSVYNFERKQERASTPGAIHARKYNLKEYIEWRMNPDIGETIRNFHTVRCISRREYWLADKFIKENNLLSAVNTVKQTEMIGLVERFDESIVCFEEYLRQFFPEIDLAYRIQNVGQSKNVTKEERIRELRSEIGEDTFQKLLENNDADLRLYDLVCREFADRVALIKDFSGKLEHFKERCKELHE